MATPTGWGELVFADAHDSAVVSRAVQRGTLRRLGRGVLTGAVDVDPAIIARRHLWRILAHVLPGAVIADASARHGGMPRGGRLFVVHSHRRPVELAGVAIHPRPGPGPVDGDMSLPDGIWMSSTERAPPGDGRVVEDVPPWAAPQQGRRQAGGAWAGWTSLPSWSPPLSTWPAG